MIDAMEYIDYGYHHDVQGRLMENITGSAFMIYENHRWNIKYQSLANVPGISSLEEKAAGLFRSGMNLTGVIRYSKGGSVVKNKAIQLHY